MNLLSKRDRVFKVKQGFTLVELLVVVTLILVLISLLTPAVEQAVEEARKAACASNQHVIHVGVYDYALANFGQLTPPWDGGPSLGRIQIAMDTLSVERLSKSGLMTTEKKQVTCYNSDGTTTTITEREPLPMWTCPSRGYTGVWQQPVTDFYHLILGYQYMGGVERWANPNNPAPGIESFSPLSVPTSKGGWVLTADTTIRFGAGGGATAGWGKGWDKTYGGMPSHRRGRDMVPTGGNQAHMDGAVAWYNFDQMYWYHSWGSSRPAFFYQADSGGFVYNSAKNYMK